jgi:hypothetical protein
VKSAASERAGCGARRDVVSQIGVSRRDNTVEWCRDDFESFERFKLIDIRLVCRNHCLVLAIGVSRCIKILSGNDVPLEKVLGAPIGDFRQVKSCLRHLKLSLRLFQLLNDFGSVDLGQNVSRFDLGPNIRIPLPQVPTCLSKDRRLSIGFASVRATQEL